MERSHLTGLTHWIVVVPSISSEAINNEQVLCCCLVAFACDYVFLEKATPTSFPSLKLCRLGQNLSRMEAIVMASRMWTNVAS